MAPTVKCIVSPSQRCSTVAPPGIIRPILPMPPEQATMFFRDPSGNALEFKAFADDTMLFATEMSA
jgi:hypothetical protein